MGRKGKHDGAEGKNGNGRWNAGTSVRNRIQNSSIMVSICCITYNQASYIRDALEGFVNQKTDFAYEVLIHDDASNDGTADIIREYADRYPDLIFPILQTENQYSKGLTNVSGTFNFPRARRKYIAMCEGDDYWTDDRKLQKQVDYLEANPGCSLCFHSAKVEIQGKALTEHAMRPCWQPHGLPGGDY